MGEAFRYSEDSEHIDISIIRYDGGKKVINYSGARRKLIHIRQEEPTILEGDNFPIGGMHLEPKRFYSKQELKISKRDTIYISEQTVFRINLAIQKERNSHPKDCTNFLQKLASMS